MIVVVDYGMGNVGSVLNMLRKLGAKSCLSAEPIEIASADRFILPGVGAFDAGIRNLTGIAGYEMLCQRVLQDGAPILGICLGMQLFTKSSEEGVLPGLGWIDARTVRIPDAGSGTLRLPHMGWNVAHAVRPSPLFPSSTDPQRFYFVHSYHVVCHDDDDVLAQTSYGITFTSSLCRGNIVGAQFHPEKSHRFGIGFLDRFLRWTPLPRREVPEP